MVIRIPLMSKHAHLITGETQIVILEVQTVHHEGNDIGERIQPWSLGRLQYEIKKDGGDVAQLKQCCDQPWLPEAIHAHP